MRNINHHLSFLGLISLQNIVISKSNLMLNFTHFSYGSSKCNKSTNKNHQTLEDYLEDTNKWDVQLSKDNRNYMKSPIVNNDLSLTRYLENTIEQHAGKV